MRFAEVSWENSNKFSLLTKPTDLFVIHFFKSYAIIKAVQVFVKLKFHAAYRLIAEPIGQAKGDLLESQEKGGTISFLVDLNAA